MELSSAAAGLSSGKLCLRCDSHTTYDGAKRSDNRGLKPAAPCYSTQHDKVSKPAAGEVMQFC